MIVDAKELAKATRLLTLLKPHSEDKRALVGVSMRQGLLFLRSVAGGVSMSIPLQAEGYVGESEERVLDGAALHKIAQRRKGSVSVEFSEDGGVMLANEGAKWGLKPLDFPLPEDDGTFRDTGSLPASSFLKLLRTVEFALPKGGVKPELNGVHLHTDGDKLVAVATNSAVLARYAVVHDGFMSVVDGLTIPEGLVELIVRVLKAAPKDGKVTIWHDGSRISLECGGVSFSTTLVERPFPDYKRILWDGKLEGHEIDNLALATAIDLTLSQGDGYCSIKKTDEGLAVYSGTPYYGKAVTVLDDDCPLSTRVSFNPHFVLPILSREIVVDWGLGTVGSHIRFHGLLDEEFKAVVSPALVADIGLD